MKKLLLIGMAALLSSAALAYPTLMGPTGLVVMPTAVVVAPGAVDIAADYTFLTQSRKDADRPIPVRLEWGLVRNFEVGAAYDYIRGQHTLDLNAKWVTPFDLLGTKLAVGAMYERVRGAGNDAAVTPTDRNAYLVDTFKLFHEGGVVFHGNVGLTYDNIHNLNGHNPSFARAMFGIEATVPAVHHFSLAMDFIPKDTANTGITYLGRKNTVSIVGRIPIAPAINAEVGETTVSNNRLTGNPTEQLFAGLDLVF